MEQKSLPSRERGLKFVVDENTQIINLVAPLAGAWIEMLFLWPVILPSQVAPLAGAWIEIQKCTRHIVSLEVAPLAGAWIEISHNGYRGRERPRRSPRGSVD